MLPLLIVLNLFCAIVEGAQTVLKSKSEVYENVLTSPEDASDPSAWEGDKTYSGIT
jgi:hypothetical protein